MEQESILWSPSKELRNSCALTQFAAAAHPCRDYEELHRWSVEKSGDFWWALFKHLDLIHEGSAKPVWEGENFQGRRWFPNVRLNYAENLLERSGGSGIAVRELHESGRSRTLSWSDLKREVARIQQFFDKTVSSSDCVAAYMPNSSETLIAMLATAASGAVFCSASCDFGVDTVVSRFEQAAPKILVAASHYSYKGRIFDLQERVHLIAERLPSVEVVLLVNTLDQDIASDYPRWDEIKHTCSGPNYKRLEFSAPLFYMFSSGTTGRPKGIIHSSGGVLLQQLKELNLHLDMDSDDKLLFFTTCGWMMWNWMASALALGTQLVLYEGSPAYPSCCAFIDLIEREGISILGTSPKFLSALKDEGWTQNTTLHNLSHILTTGSPLPANTYDFVYSDVKQDVRLISLSGGTDILGCFVLGSPWLPIHRGRIQCKALGMDVIAADTHGHELVDQEGELVCRKPFPSVPLGFLGPDGAERFHSSYFAENPNVWTHGDYIRIDERGIEILGRSDSTLNPGGVRIGSAEIYRQVETLDEIEDSICIGQEMGEDTRILLFVKLAPYADWSSELEQRIKQTLKQNCSARHVPAEIRVVDSIPYTHSGKKMEKLVTQLVNGKQVDDYSALKNPDSLEAFSFPPQIRREG